MPYHLTATKRIAECNCRPCKAKYGSWATEEEALEALAALEGFNSLQAAANASDFDPPAAIEAEEAAFEENILSNFKANNTEPPGNKSSYFDDDEAFLRAEDEILAVGPEAALISQDENVVSWKLDNFYDDGGKRRSKYALRASPPILTVASSTGETVEFLLTKDLTATLAEVMGDVNRGFYGVDPKKKNSLTQEASPSKWVQVRDYATANPLRSAFLSLVIVLCFIGIFIL